MKKVYSIFLFLFISATTFAQGIAVQGIARDNTSSAIINTTLTYTFSITKNDNTILYKETQSIKTDNFGVFSHIVSTGNPVTNTFTSVDFSLENLKIKVSVNYNGSAIDVYDQPFQYVPYAKYAENGVPTGTVVSFLGATAPRGWLLCDGSAIPTINTALRTLLGTTTTPNLKGMFLRGIGQSAYGTNSTGPSLRNYQSDSNEAHTHNSGSYVTDTEGNHNHNNGIYNVMLSKNVAPYYSSTPTGFDNTADELDIFNLSTIKAAGSHNHDVQGNSGSSGGTETRPVNYGVNYIIKL
ncbi:MULTISPECIES: phage tail protein [unclassified Polaribacter]|uniref:phage tail protein n=1 Tax=unclassified Polaribacter TaxID=196858 RepID=UPI0011BF60F3|nr:MULTISPECIES: phage tail protein [unclassified Polaribacter]TXD51039.1 tail fiber protein [Polaribacter sp. IC063]TXD62345.1 tail fiber protein [Polaribacter sp. IC066]